jgi:peptidoglycan/xylan/chitin deacetylase (PgdA/CDA1 family)
MTPPGLGLVERTFGRGGIVAYHGVREGALLPSTHITPAAIEAQFEFLADKYRVLPLPEFVARRNTGKSVRGCVAITFDDAYVGILTHVRPILERLGLGATVFVASSFCVREKRFWWDRFEWVLQRIEPEAGARLLREAGLGGQAADQDVRDLLLTRFRGALPRALDLALQRAESQVGLVPERAMTTEELVQLARCELVDFGCHTVHHYALPWLAAPKAEKEIRLNHAWLRERLPRVRPYLAYPYGLYTSATVEAARRSGMEAAFSIAGRAATSRFPLFSCPRVGMADVNSLRGLRLRLAWATIPVVAVRDRGWIAQRTP